MSKHIEISKCFKKNPSAARLFVGFDGRLHISDRNGTHIATAAALALLVRPALRADGERSGHND